MDNIENAPYSAWLEDVIKTIFEQNPDQIAVCARLEDACTMTAYYNCCAEDKAIFANHINSDAAMDMVLNNIGMVKQALDEYEEAGDVREES